SAARISSSSQWSTRRPRRPAPSGAGWRPRLRARWDGLCVRTTSTPSPAGSGSTSSPVAGPRRTVARCAGAPAEWSTPPWSPACRSSSPGRPVRRSPARSGPESRWSASTCGAIRAASRRGWTAPTSRSRSGPARRRSSGSCCAPAPARSPSTPQGSYRLAGVTYSIVARNAETGELGAAIQSAAFGAGVHTLWVEAGVGAVASQSFSDPSYGPMCLLALRTGATAAAALAAATRRDRMSPYRQVGVVSASGTAAAFTGAACVAEAGHLHRRNVACQANMMASTAVWPAMMEAYRAAPGPMAERLLVALEAAQAAGGDWRGQEAGRVLVVRGEPSGMPWNDVVCDVRVDNHSEPVAELRRLVERGQALRAAWEPDAALSSEEA